MTSGNPADWPCGIAMRGGALILGFAAAMALGFNAQVPAQGTTIPSVFDGEYTGTATPTTAHGGPLCDTANVKMTIAAGRVTIYAVFSTGQLAPVYSGSGTVDPAGKVSASVYLERGARGNLYITLRGNIKGSNFTGTFNTSKGNFCSMDASMTKKQSS
jgi:hypothetical protein